MMSPQGMPRPSQDAIESLASWLEDSIDRAAKCNTRKRKSH